MPVDYVTRISAFGWSDLADLWTKIDKVPKSRITGWASGMALEHLVLRAFQLNGAEVIWPYSVNLHGQLLEQIDGMIVVDGIICMVEVKDQASTWNRWQSCETSCSAGPPA